MEGSSSNTTARALPKEIDVWFKTAKSENLEKRSVLTGDLFQFQFFSDILESVPNNQDALEKNRIESLVSYEDLNDTIITAAAFATKNDCEEKELSTPLYISKLIDDLQEEKIIRTIATADKLGLKNEKTIKTMREHFELGQKINVLFKTNTPDNYEKRSVTKRDLLRFQVFSHMFESLSDNQDAPENNEFPVPATYENFVSTIKIANLFALKNSYKQQKKSMPTDKAQSIDNLRPKELLRAIETADMLNLKEEKTVKAMKKSFEYSANKLSSSSKITEFIHQFYNSKTDTLFSDETSLIYKKLCTALYQEAIKNQTSFTGEREFNKLIFNKNETLLATTYFIENGPVRVFDIKTREFLCHSLNPITSTQQDTIIPDPDSDGFITISNLQGSTAIAKWNGRTGNVHCCMRFNDASFEGESLTFASYQEPKNGFNAKTEELNQPNLNCTKDIVLSPNGKKLASYALNGSTITIWDMQTNKKLKDLSSINPYGEHIANVEFSPNGKLITFSHKGHKKLLNTKNEKVFTVQEGYILHQIYDDAVIFSDRAKKNIKIFDPKTGTFKKIIYFSEAKNLDTDSLGIMLYLTAFLPGKSEDLQRMRKRNGVSKL